MGKPREKTASQHDTSGTAPGFRRRRVGGHRHAPRRAGGLAGELNFIADDQHAHRRARALRSRLAEVLRRRPRRRRTRSCPSRPASASAFSGPNGAGKTTTIEICEGLTTPDSGDVELLGLRWDDNEHELRERLGIQLQETQLAEKLTVEETVRLFRSFYARGRTVDDVIRLVQLDEKRGSRVGKLCGGQKQRLALACAIVGDPDLLFLDEPTTGLDPQSRRQLWDLITEFKALGRTIMLTTHYMDEAEILCDRVAIVDHGKVIALGTPSELIASLGAEHVVEFTRRRRLPRLDEAELRALDGVIARSARRGRLRVAG